MSPRRHRFSPPAFTLKLRLKIVVTIVLLLVVGGPLFYLLHVLDRSHEEFSANMIETTTNAVYQSIFDALLVNDTTGIQQNIEQIALQPTIKLLRIYRPDGEILYSNLPGEIRSDIHEIEHNPVPEPEPGQSMEMFSREEEHWAHQHPIYIQKECLGCHQPQETPIAMMDVHVALAESEYLYATVKRLTIISAVLIIGILWAVLNLLYDSQIETRLRKILRGFEELAEGNLSARVEITGRHELANLADRFNQTVRELRDAREKEERLIHENLTRADRLVTLGEVAAELAHEVNNPAGIILSRAEIIKDEMESDGLNGSYRDDMSMIILQTERIAETTRSILHFARKLPQEYAAVDINEVIEQSVRMLAPRLKKAGVEVQVTAGDGEATVHGNFHQLEQVICNLINNSMDAMEGRGGVIRIAIDAIPGEERFRIRLQDDGPGIPEGLRPKIFAPFFTSKPEGRGTGLGLYIVRNILNNHQGSIYLPEQPPNGAAFIIELRKWHGQSEDTGR